MPQPSTHLSYVMKAISRMDADFLATLLHSDNRYMDMHYLEFITRMREIFSEFTDAGDTKLLFYHGKCGSTDCVFGHKGFCFVGNNSNSYMNILFTEKEGRVCDMTECGEFILQHPKVKLTNRICIVKYDMRGFLKWLSDEASEKCSR